MKTSRYEAGQPVAASNAAGDTFRAHLVYLFDRKSRPSRFKYNFGKQKKCLLAQLPCLLSFAKTVQTQL